MNSHFPCLCQFKSLPRTVRDLLGSPPRRGGGLHQWLFRMARALHPHRSRDEIIEILHLATIGEPVPPSEIEQAVDNSAATTWRPKDFLPYKKSWPSLDKKKRSSIISEEADHSEFLVRVSSDAQTEDVIDALFPGDPLLCCGTTSRDFATRPRSDWRGKLSAMQFIVPSPMTTKFGLTKEGKKSQHTSSNTGPRRFLVIEQDSGSMNEQSAILAHLAKKAPLALVVHSGGKSLHGWFFCGGRSEESWYKFMEYAVILGADHHMWTRLQFARMPGGSRDSGAEQAILYFNPEVIAK